MQALPIMTPSMVNMALPLCARSACMARLQVSAHSKGALFEIPWCSVTDLLDAGGAFEDTGCGLTINAKTSRADQGGSWPLCHWGRVAGRRDTVHPLLSVFPVIRRDAPARCERRRGKASHCDRRCWRGRISNPFRLRGDCCSLIRGQLPGRTRGADRWD